MGSETIGHFLFRVVWRGVNLLLVAAVMLSLYAGLREYSVRQYLDGFSDAIVPNVMPEDQKLEAILDWMRAEPSRAVSINPDALPKRDPEMTLTYKQLLGVCGTATNAFLNLARSSDVRARRLLLLGPDGKTKHVVAEVLVDGRWIVVDPTYRFIMKDAAGRYLTRQELQNPAVFAQAISAVPNYPHEYTYDYVAHVRLSRVPLVGQSLRRLFDATLPGWEEAIDWSLLLERVSFFYLVLSVAFVLLFLVLRVMLAWYADSRLRIRRFRLREHVWRAGAAFFSTPEIKQ
ncbi:MAG TPA: transglutaminase-like domain-containing protein [Candidatus Acidoferrum sp.]|nr:transglutaminase-like domain-containing protein [Candidatus Acidoferrum sp.]